MELVAFFGDTHGNLKLMWELAIQWEKQNNQKLSYIFQVGDFGIWPAIDRLDPPTVNHAKNHGYTLKIAMGDFPEVFLGEYKIPIPTYFIRGNHEDQEFLMTFEKKHRKENPTDYLTKPIEICPNLFYVPDGHIITLGPSRIAGWGGCWGKKTWEMEYWGTVRAARNKQGYARRLNHMTRDIYERLLREEFDILVTHDAPTGSGVQGMLNPSSSNLDPESISEGTSEGTGVPYIRKLIEEIQPLYQFNGHWHEFQYNVFGSTEAYVLDKVHPESLERHFMEVLELPHRVSQLSG